MSTPTIRGTTAAGVGVTYIPVDRFQAYLSMQWTVANGPTFTIDGTGDDILWNTAVLPAANVYTRAIAVDPSNAMWDEIQASGSAAGDFITERRFRALRINITAGASATVTYVINQGGDSG